MRVERINPITSVSWIRYWIRERKKKKEKKKTKKKSIDLMEVYRLIKRLI